MHYLLGISTPQWEYHQGNNFKLCSGNMLNFCFQKQYYGLLSLNNKHVGAKLNRDQIIIKTIPKMLLKKEKRLNLLLFMWPKHEFAPRRAAPGLRPDSQWAGHQSGPERSPTWASFGPGHRGALSAVGSNPTAGRDPRGIKTGDAGSSSKT